MLQAQRSRAFQVQAIRPPEADSGYLSQLRTGGWAVLAAHPYDDAPALLSATQAYFAQDAACKDRDTMDFDAAHFDGYGSQGAQKEMLFVRNAPLPAPVAVEAQTFWQWAHQLAQSVLSDVAREQGVDPRYFLELITGSCALPSEAGTNVLRLFHYRPPVQDSQSPPQPSNAHHDLGLLAIGLRSTPGLQAQTPDAPGWHDIEPGLPKTHAVVMVGRTLSTLTGGRYPSCYHRIVHGDVPRFSAVYQLRVRDDARLYAPHFRHANADYPIPTFDLTGEQLHHFFDVALPSINRRD
jgi:hypothetical protein